ncbi:MAG: SUMF1/EgtB/PvdO family nonheme iron enzyme [Acidobacteria bacterium]|nr:SUMF1/EgtB/PvdO family nonheme iron enzyme [Acidobacteriota bacterium]
MKKERPVRLFVLGLALSVLTAAAGPGLPGALASPAVPEMVALPAGEFVMGDHYGYIDPSHPSDEVPMHTVRLSAFSIGRYDVTVRQYCGFLNSALALGLIRVADGSVYPAGGSDLLFLTRTADPYSRIAWSGTAFSVLDNRGDHPVTSVMWAGAAFYCNWLSDQLGLDPCYDTATWAGDLTKNGFRLPTEAEWEYAGRGGRYDPYLVFPWGLTMDITRANIPNSGDPFESGAQPWTTPVGFFNGQVHQKSDWGWPGSATSFAAGDGANGFGLYDMAGNVWQWTNDWYDKDYYSVSPTQDPPGPATGSPMPDGKPYHCLRGGNWYNGTDGHSRVSNRDPAYYRGPLDPNHPWYHVGFRVANRPYTAPGALHFPWGRFVPLETTVGLAFVNTGSSDASVALSAHDPAGAAAGSPLTIPLPAGNQAALQADGLPGLATPADVRLEATPSSSAVRGFFLAQLYDGGQLAGLDGASAVAAATTDGIIPRVRNASGYSTGLAIGNPGDTAVTVTLTGCTGTGIVSGGSHSVAAKGCLYLDTAALFTAVSASPDARTAPGASSGFDGAVRLRATGGVVATALTRHDTGTLSAVNLVPAVQAASSLVAAHITRIPDLYFTELNLVNPGETDAVATLSPFSADGTALAAPFTVTVPARQVLALRDAALGLPSGTSSEGWLRVTTPDATPLVGCVTFGHPGDNRYESTLPLQASGLEDIHFAQVANGTVGGVNYFTGVAVVNPAAAPVQVTFRVFRSDGTANGNAAVIQVPAGGKYVRLLSQVDGIGTLTDQSGGCLRLTATGAVFAFELFGNWEGGFLSAVPAQP